MPLDPIAERYIADLAAQGVQPVYVQTPEQARASRLPPPPGPEVTQVQDFTVIGRDASFRVRVYWPKQSDTPQPALVWYHGGGWVLGSLDIEDATARRLATFADCVVVSVDYRLAPEHPFPAGLEDAYTAVTWTVEHAGTLGIDPERVAIGGYSAGANLAAVVARRLRDRGGPWIVHQVLVNPVTDAAMDTESYRVNDRYVLTPDSMRWYFDQYCPPSVDRGDPDVSPLRAPDLSGLAPATVVTVEFDPLRDEGEAYVEALVAAGVPVESRRFDGQIHVFFGNAHIFPAAVEAAQFVAGRLRAAFDGSARFRC